MGAVLLDMSQDVVLIDNHWLLKKNASWLFVQNGTESQELQEHAVWL